MCSIRGKDIYAGIPSFSVSSVRLYIVQITSCEYHGNRGIHLISYVNLKHSSNHCDIYVFLISQDDSSLVSTSLIVICVDVVVSVLGMIGSIFLHFFTLILSLFFVLPYLGKCMKNICKIKRVYITIILYTTCICLVTVFRMYSIWVLYSYTIEISQPVTVNA